MRLSQHPDRRGDRREEGAVPEHGAVPRAGRGLRSARLVPGVVAIQSMLLAALGVAGLGSAAGRGLTAQPPPEVLGFRMTGAHSLLLLGTGLLALAVLRHQAWLRRYLAAQTLVFLALCLLGWACAGSASGAVWNPNLSDRVLHAVLFVVGLTCLLLLRQGSPGRSTDRRPNPGGQVPKQRASG
jgi:hypothetical protein